MTSEVPLTASGTVAPVKLQNLSPEALHTGKVPSVPVPVAPEAGVGPVVPLAPAKKENMLVKYWRAAGGGSFMLSMVVHAIILVAAYFVVEVIVTEEKVDFLPGGGSKSGQDAGQQLSQQVQAKRNSFMKKSTPMQRVVSTSASAAIALPDMPLDSIDMPDLSSQLGGGAMGGGKLGSGGAGFGSAGAGGGYGNGVGLGGLKGITFFGFKTNAQRLAFLVDYSGSMQGPFREAMEVELERSLKALPAGTEVMIIPWAGGAWLFDEKAPEIAKKWEKLGASYDNWRVKEGEKLEKPKWLAANPANIKRIMKGVNDQAAWPGGTDWRSPFRYAMEAYPPPDTIFFLTDGQINDSKAALAGVEEALKKAQTPPKVFSLWIQNDKFPPDHMKTLSRRFKGEFREVEDPAKPAKKKR